MSFILDALKKSENERQRYQGPSLVDTPVRHARNERPWWAFGLAALLLLNLLVFGIVLLRGNDEPAATANVSAAPAAQPVAQPPAPAAPRPATTSASRQPVDPPIASAPATDPAVRSLAAEAGVPEEEDVDDLPSVRNPDLAAASDVPEGPPIVRPIQGPATSPAPAPPARRDEVLPTINDLTASGSAQVPPMHLDIHVYSTSPAERFVFINMRKYREGESMAEGPVIERIDRDGVVMNHRGLRFLMPRQ